MFPEVTSISIRRKRLAISQSRFAKLAGISQSMLTKIEHGKVVPSYTNAVNLFNTLDELEHSEEKTAKELMKKHVIELGADDTVGKAAKLAKQHSVSQFVVLEGKRVVGSVKTANLISVSHNSKIRECIEPPFPTINENTPIGIIKELLKHEQAIVVTRKGEVNGIITAEDLL